MPATFIPSVALLIDRIANDENVVSPLTQAVAGAAIEALDKFRLAASPPGYVNSRTYLDAITNASIALHPVGFNLRTPGNQAHLVNNYRYGDPVHLIISSAKKVEGGFRVNEKGSITLMIVENSGQYALFPKDEPISLESKHFWVLHEICERTRHMTIYLARPMALLEDNTLLQTTEFRKIFDDDLRHPSPANTVSELSPQDAENVQSEPISVLVTERSNTKFFDDSISGDQTNDNDDPTNDETA